MQIRQRQVIVPPQEPQVSVTIEEPENIERIAAETEQEVSDLHFFHAEKIVRQNLHQIDDNKKKVQCLLVLYQKESLLLKAISRKILSESYRSPSSIANQLVCDAIHTLEDPTLDDRLAFQKNIRTLIEAKKRLDDRQIILEELIKYRCDPSFVDDSNQLLAKNEFETIVQEIANELLDETNEKKDHCCATFIRHCLNSSRFE